MLVEGLSQAVVGMSESVYVCGRCTIACLAVNPMLYFRGLPPLGQRTEPNERVSMDKE